MHKRQLLILLFSHCRFKIIIKISPLQSPSFFNQTSTNNTKQIDKQAITQRAIRERIKIKRVSKGYPSPSRSLLVGTPCEL